MRRVLRNLIPLFGVLLLCVVGSRVIAPASTPATKNTSQSAVNAAAGPTTKDETKGPDAAKTEPEAIPKTKTVTRVTATTSRGDADNTPHQRKIRVLATGYSAPCKYQGTGLYTFTGRRVQKMVQGKIVKVPGVAVDPRVIPLGSLVKINGRQYLADDTGGAIKGRRIDIRFDTRKQALTWGKRWITVTVHDEREVGNAEPGRKDKSSRQGNGPAECQEGES